MAGTETAFERHLIYAAVFRATLDQRPYAPLVTRPYGDGSLVTAPHGLDREVAVTLPGLWYCLHLPNTLAQLVDLSAATLKASQALHLDHHILLAPIQIFDREHVGGWLASGVPVLAVCPDELADETAQRSEALDFAFPPMPYSQMSDASLVEHWRSIHAALAGGSAYLGREPSLTHRLDVAPTDLPRRWLARQFDAAEDSPSVADGNRDGVVAEALRAQMVLAATARLEREEVSLSAARQMLPDEIEREQHRLRVPVVVAAPGVASSYIRGAGDRSLRERVAPMTDVDAADTWSPTVHQRDDALVERAAIEFVTTHRAIARGGIGVMLPSISPEAFGILLQVEEHFQARRPRGSAVWRLLDRLDAATAHIWTDATIALVARASMLTVFSNFPLGLLRLPGDTAPIAARMPIAYRPLLPLTRTIQQELTYVPPIDLSSGLRVLVAQCIPADDAVGAASRLGWSVAAEGLNGGREAITLDVVETLSIDALRTAIADHQPDVLVIAAHGALSENRSLAGLHVGDEVVAGPGLGPLPPVVILSACHVAPRGAGTVSVTDLLLREGAVAVLGTQVPVNVRRNATLMVRFFVYISEVLAARESHLTLLDVWQRVQMSNAVNDVLRGNPRLAEWALSPTASGSSVLEEFMRTRSTGRLRPAHIYADTEQVLGEIADELGDGTRVRGWFRQPGYVPESLFYLFAGCPERVYLRPLADAIDHDEVGG